MISSQSIEYKFSKSTNLVIKKELPLVGVTCSNPQRAMRLINSKLDNARIHSDSWGVTIYTGEYKNTRMFVAIVPMGSAGAGFAFLEMFVAGAEHVIRYGSNDRYIESEQLRDIILINRADNLNGSMMDAGVIPAMMGKPINSCPMLMAVFLENAKETGHPVKQMVCHNVDDYHAFNYPDLLPKLIGDRVKRRIKNLENGQPCAWDMETAALYWRAKQFKASSLTVMQSLIKHKGEDTAYDGLHGQISIEMESMFGELIFSSLYQVL